MTQEMKALIEKVHQRIAEVIVFSDRHDLLQMSQQNVRLPGDVPEWLSPISSIIPGQMLAMYLAEARGFDVDNPRGLRKVTETW
jgi:glucosamine--fructose-6-phosphate aminotransferase (isomerizing)